MTWNDTFLELFRRCLKSYEAGNTDFMSYYSDEDLSFLASIGYKPCELFDFVEDLGDGGVPTESTALLVAAVRRDYFQVVKNNEPGTRELGRGDFPPFEEETNGIAYLPRITAKAMAKLNGELDPDVMFGCGADRRFLSTHGDINPADFLRQVWAADGDAGKVSHFVKRASA